MGAAARVLCSVAGVASIASAAAGCGGASPPPVSYDPRPPPNAGDETGRARPEADEADESAEPNDGVKITSTKGHMDPAAVNAGLAAQRAELGRCYTDNVGKRRWLGGHVLLRWEVAANGAFSRVLLTDSDLGAWPIEKCLLEVAHGAKFGKPVGGAAELTLPLEFSASSATGAWGIEQSAKAVGGQLLKLEVCAKAGGKAGDKRRGARAQRAMPEEVTITIYVGPHGRAQSVGFASATSVLDDAWAECAEKAALAWELPDPKGQVTKLAVRYRPR